jgi:hypothetical protein
MGFWKKLKELFSRRPPERDLARAPGIEDPDAVSEAVDTSGGPLKPGHRRLALRDDRLWPKRKRPRGRRGERPRHFSRADAARLFAATLRTRDRRIRDLLSDEEQLARYDLPPWRDEAALAAALELSPGALRHYSIHRERERALHYVCFRIPKRGGGERLIMAPKRRLKAIQRRLNALLVSRLPVSEHAHGFRRGRSIRTGAEPHVGHRVLLQLDLADFFPTIHVGRVRGLLCALGYSFPIATALAVLMTEAERQPVEVEGVLYHVPVGPRFCVQGAPTSPGLANALCLRLDRRLAGLARTHGFVYTRYADDLSFSGDDPSRLRRLRSLVARIVSEEGFRLNPRKTRVARAGRAQRVTGVTVNQVVGLSRRERRRLRAELHRLTRGEPSPEARRRLAGKLAYVAMLNPAQAEVLARRAPASIRGRP